LLSSIHEFRCQKLTNCWLRGAGTPDSCPPIRIVLVASFTGKSAGFALGSQSGGFRPNPRRTGKPARLYSSLIDKNGGQPVNRGAEA
jgi:hypothetical protein